MKCDVTSTARNKQQRQTSFFEDDSTGVLAIDATDIRDDIISIRLVLLAILIVATHFSTQ